jgi:Cu+-exporting ATPase
MRVDAWTATLALEHEGHRFVFCAERCRERFMAEPESYLNQSH